MLETVPKSSLKNMAIRRLRSVLCMGFAVLFLVINATGCSIFSSKKALYSGYEQTRRGINDPLGEVDASDEIEGDGVYRPEGVTAEKAGSETDFWERVGLRQKRRKDLELARSQYQEADELLSQANAAEGEERPKLFRSAAEKYKEAASNWRSSGLEQDALLMAAESYFFAEDYYRAEQHYAQLNKEFPRHPYVDHVSSRLFEIADFWLKTDSISHKPFVVLNVSDPKYPWNDTGGHGKRVLENMRLEYPTGKVSDDATMRLAVEDFQRGKFETAADTFADLRLTFPDSEHQFNAHFLELQSLLKSYQGPDYSSIPMTEAQQRVKQIARQFPQEAKERQAELNEAYAKIRFAMAERIWHQADYRYKRSEFGSAKFHYNRILEEYDDTPFAERAEERLSDLEGLPDDPPQRFKSLIWLFGDTNNDRPWKSNTPAEE